MSPSKTTNKTHDQTKILVLGDVHIDNVIVPIPRIQKPLSKGSQANYQLENWQKDIRYHWFRRPGGAWLLKEIIKAGVKSEDSESDPVKTYDEDEAKKACKSLEPPYLESLARLEAFPKKPSESDPDKDKVYRIPIGGLVGWRSCPLRKDEQIRELCKEKLKELLSELKDKFDNKWDKFVNKWDELKNNPAQLKIEIDEFPRLIVIHDHNNGYRELEPKDSIKPFLDENPYFKSPREDLGASRFCTLHFKLCLENLELPLAFLIYLQKWDAPEDFKPPGEGIILWHTDAPFAKGKLWDFLHKNYADQTVVIVTVGDLRNSGINIPDEISFEQSAIDFIKHIDNPQSPLCNLANCRNLLVRFSNGVIHYSSINSIKKTAYLNFSFLPNAFVSRSFSEDINIYGWMVGYASILIGTVAKAIIDTIYRSDYDEKNLSNAITIGAQTGVILAQKHFLNGYASSDYYKNLQEPKPDKNLQESEPYPYKDLFDLLKKNDQNDQDAKRKLANLLDDFHIASIDIDPNTLRSSAKWTRIDDFSRVMEKSTEEEAINVVLRGLQKVVDDLTSEKDEANKSFKLWEMPRRIRFPYAAIGDLKLVDRHQIDMFSSIKILISNYLSRPKLTRPLSIAVFGPPGSGKSFTIKQILKSARTGKESQSLEYNVAQFRGIDDLAIAFHQVQDIALSDEVPLVFFDEFDTTYQNAELGWLQYFLAPMQDGKFKDGESMYQVGRAIFVFAGGVSETFDDFYVSRKDNNAFKSAKGPDFVSRLRGHLNIVGLNSDNGEISGLLMFRRAILLRAFLEKSCPLIIDSNTKEAKIDKNVVRAFLHTKKYEHGVRSMEAIVEMANISRSRRSFQKSSLPAEEQLNMHVNAENFLSFVHCNG